MLTGESFSIDGVVLFRSTCDVDTGEANMGLIMEPGATKDVRRAVAILIRQFADKLDPPDPPTT